MRVMPKRGDLYPGDDDMAEYLSYLRDGDYQDLPIGIWELSNYHHLSLLLQDMS